jgi:hypothetical protein
MTLAGESRSIRRKNLSQLHDVHHKSHMDRRRNEPGLPGERPATNRLSYGAVLKAAVNLNNV